MRRNLIEFTLVVISLSCAYFAFASYMSLGNFQAYLNVMEKRYAEINNQMATLREEDRLLNLKLDIMNKKISEQNDKIRIQDALIAETRARKKK